jgi:hypothetical protein
VFELLLESVCNFKVNILRILIQVVVRLTFWGRYVIHDDDLKGNLVETLLTWVDIKVDTADFLGVTTECIHYCSPVNLLRQWNPHRHFAQFFVSTNVTKNVFSLAKSHVFTSHNLELHPPHIIQVLLQHIVLSIEN